MNALERRLSLDQQFATLGSQISALQRQYADIAAERNKLAPIEAFPPELLVEVFSHLPELPMIAVMHVCRRWHQVCVGASSLWTTVECEKEWDSRAIDLATRYSGSRLVSLRAARLESLPSHASLQLRALAPKLCELHLSTKDTDRAVLAAAVTDIELPRLHKLELWSAHLAGGEDDSDEDESLMVSLAIPAIRQLSLERVSLQLEPYVGIISLTKLSLRHCPSVLPHTLLRVLNGCPALTEFGLTHSLAEPQDPADRVPALPDVHLALLEDFYLEEDDTHVGVIADHLSIPPECNIYLDIGPTHVDLAVECLRFARRIVDRAHSDSLVFDVVVISSLNDGTYIVEVGAEASNDRGNVLKQIQGYVPDEEDIPAPIIPFVEALWLPTIEALVLGQIEDLAREPEEWVSIFDAMPTIQTISFQEPDAVVDWLDILTALIPHTLARVKKIDLPISDSAGMDGLVASLVAFLKAFRAARRRKLSCLILTRRRIAPASPGLNSSQHSLLAKLVTHLEVEEDDSDSESSDSEDHSE
ncbi:F-box domain-containing protein [Mycena kentingensis (nom. inval.)]|nr:F-box domain-containing protein [Mycena kentingensis (nom. inval.)]